MHFKRVVQAASAK